MGLKDAADISGLGPCRSSRPRLFAELFREENKKSVQAAKELQRALDKRSDLVASGFKDWSGSARGYSGSGMARDVFRSP